MDKKILFIAVPIVIIAIIGGVILSQSKKATPSEEQTPPTQAVKQTGEETFSGSILNLLKRGKNVSCTYKMTNEAGTTEGMVYMAGEKMKGEFKTVATNGQEFDSSIIRDSKYTYSWSSVMAGGTKMKIEKDAEQGESTEAEKDDTTKSLEQDVDLKCKGWSVDNSMFVPPSNIEFKDLSAQVEQVEKTAEDLESQQKAVCDQLSGQVKQQCLDALNSGN